MSLHLPSNVIAYGVPDALPETRVLRAGPVTALLEGADLRYIRYGKHEILRRIYVALRDRNWGTVMPRFSNWEIHVEPDSFVVTFDVTHERDDIDFFWRGDIRGEKDGTIRYSMDGVARSTFWRNRLGFCVLHPAQATTTDATIEHVDGSTDETQFPHWIVADQPVPPFSEMRALSYEVAPGIKSRVEFDGDIFEVEDQRNWTDASYKTFSTPLRLPFPVEVKEGTRIHQGLTITVEIAGDEQPVSMSSDTSLAEIRLSDETHDLPEIGLGSASHGAGLTGSAVNQLKSLALDHLRVDLNLTEAGWQDDLARADGESRALDIPLQVALFTSHIPDAELQALRTVLDKLTPQVKHWLVYPVRERYRETAPLREMVSEARHRLGSYDVQAKFVAGTNTDFIFMSRNVPAFDLVDAVCFSINPQVHAFDQLSVVETLQAQEYVVNSARHLASLPVLVTPVTFKPRLNPYATGQEAPTPPGQLPPQVDPRQMSLFGAVWTAVSIKYLAQAGAASVTYYETTGWRGVMETSAGSAVPDKFMSQPGMTFPLFHVFADVAELRGGQALRVTASDPLTVDALGLRRGGQTRLLICNMTNEPRAARVGPISASTVTVKRLNANTAEHALMKSDTFRVAPGESVAVEQATLKIELLPYEVARIDFLILPKEQTMKSLVLSEPYTMSFEERPVPVADPGEVVLQTRANGICGSDLHFYHGTHPYRFYPMVLGHEATARVVKLGEGVTGFEPGETVVVQPLISCGTCYPCRQGRTNCCSRMKTVGANWPGALQEFYKVPAYCLFKIPSNIPAPVASLTEPLSIGFQAVARGQIASTDRVAVIGAGPIGLAILAAAKRRGAQVAMLDLLDARLGLASSFGADLTINSGKEDAAAVLKEWTDGDMPSVVVEAVGSAKTIELAVQYVADAGRIVVVGVTEQEAHIRGVDMTRKELTIYGSRNNLGLFQEAMDYMSENQAQVSRMVTQEYPFERAVEAFEMAHAHPDQVCKVVITVSP